MTKESLMEMGLTEEQTIKVLEQLQSGFVSRNQLAEELKAARKKHDAEMREFRMDSAVNQSLQKAKAINCLLYTSPSPRDLC